MIGHWQLATGGVEDSGQTVPWAEHGGIGDLPGTRLPSGSMAECHVVRGYRFHRLPASGNGCLATRPRTLPQRRRAGRKLPCRRRLCGCSNDTPHLDV